MYTGQNNQICFDAQQKGGEILLALVEESHSAQVEEERERGKAAEKYEDFVNSEQGTEFPLHVSWDSEKDFLFCAPHCQWHSKANSLFCKFLKKRSLIL